MMTDMYVVQKKKLKVIWKKVFECNVKWSLFVSEGTIPSILAALLSINKHLVCAHFYFRH